MSEAEFKNRADAATTDLHRRLAAVGEEFGFKASLDSGVVAIEFVEPPGKFVVSPNAPEQQIWVSALSKNFKLDWNDPQNAFVLKTSGQTLADLLAAFIGEQLGDEVIL